MAAATEGAKPTAKTTVGTAAAAGSGSWLEAPGEGEDEFWFPADLDEPQQYGGATTRAHAGKSGGAAERPSARGGMVAAEDVPLRDIVHQPATELPRSGTLPTSIGTLVSDLVRERTAAKRQRGRTRVPMASGSSGALATQGSSGTLFLGGSIGQSASQVGSPTQSQPTPIGFGLANEPPTPLGGAPPTGEPEEDLGWETGFLGSSNGQRRWVQQKRQRIKWSADEDVEFFDAIRRFGTSFNLIAVLFPNRDRRDIVQKFHFEEKKNPHRLQEALSNPLPIDMDEYNERLQALEREENTRHARLTDAETMRLLDAEGGEEAQQHGEGNGNGTAASQQQEGRAEGKASANKNGKGKIPVPQAGQKRQPPPAAVVTRQATDDDEFNLGLLGDEFDLEGEPTVGLDEDAPSSKKPRLETSSKPQGKKQPASKKAPAKKASAKSSSAGGGKKETPTGSGKTKTAVGKKEVSFAGAEPQPTVGGGQVFLDDSMLDLGGEVGEFLLEDPAVDEFVLGNDEGETNKDTAADDYEW